MTIEENLKNIEDAFDEFCANFQNQIDDLKEDIENKKILDEAFGEVSAGLWKPEWGGEYLYFNTETAEIKQEQWYETSIDKLRYSLGLIAPTVEELRRKIEHKKIEAQLKDIAARLNKGREIDWKNHTLDKYNLVYFCDDGMETIEQETTGVYKIQGSIYCLDCRFQDTAIQEIGEERLKEYLKEC